MAGDTIARREGGAAAVAPVPVPRRPSAKPAASAATPSSAPPPIQAARTRGLFRTATRRGAPSALPSARTNSAALPNRSAGSFSSPVITAASTEAGTLRRCSASGFGSSVITRATIACAVGPVNGGSPASIS